MKRIIILIISGILIVGVFKASTVGWRFRGRNWEVSDRDNMELIERLKRHVYKLSAEIGDRSVFRYEQLQQAQKYITSEFRSLGYRVELQEYKVYGKSVHNIIAVKKGTTNSEELIVVGAHYDTCFNPGADDNASGIAGLIELAEILSKKKTNINIEFVAFVNEEPPFFKTDDMGSLVYAKWAKKENKKIKAAVILEMIGYYINEPNSQKYPPLFGLFYPNKGNFIAVVGNFKSKWLTKEVTSSFKKHSSFPIEAISTFEFISGIDFSDHWAFWQQGYPAVMITDTSFYRYAHYHEKSDTHDKLNYEAIAEVVKGLSGVLLEI